MIPAAVVGTFSRLAKASTFLVHHIETWHHLIQYHSPFSPNTPTVDIFSNFCRLCNSRFTAALFSSCRNRANSACLCRLAFRSKTIESSNCVLSHSHLTCATKTTEELSRFPSDTLVGCNDIELTENMLVDSKQLFWHNESSIVKQFTNHVK